MAGRSQCNKGITVGDLLDFAVLEDPCANLEDVVSCTLDSPRPSENSAWSRSPNT